MNVAAVVSTILHWAYRLASLPTEARTKLIQDFERTLADVEKAIKDAEAAIAGAVPVVAADAESIAQDLKDDLA